VRNRVLRFPKGNILNPTRQKKTSPGDHSAPPWVLAISYVIPIAGFGGGAVLADLSNRNPASPVPGWIYVASGVVLGVIAGIYVFVWLMEQVTQSRNEAARQRGQREADIQREHVRVRQDARAAALSAYPEYVDDDTLCDLAGPYAWPKDLFARFFVVPDIVIPYRTEYADSEVRLWSKAYVAEQSEELDYLDFKRALDREREEDEEARRREDEKRREAERQAQEEEEARRAERKALAARKASQITIPLDELKKRQ
jgi:hypothetical protein